MSMLTDAIEICDSVPTDLTEAQLWVDMASACIHKGIHIEYYHGMMRGMQSVLDAK